jgi:hypothetical protein
MFTILCSQIKFISNSDLILPYLKINFIIQFSVEIISDLASKLFSDFIQYFIIFQLTFSYPLSNGIIGEFVLSNTLFNSSQSQFTYKIQLFLTTLSYISNFHLDILFWFQNNPICWFQIAVKNQYL